MVTLLPAAATVVGIVALAQIPGPGELAGPGLVITGGTAPAPVTPDAPASGVHNATKLQVPGR